MRRSILFLRTMCDPIISAYNHIIDKKYLVGGRHTQKWEIKRHVGFKDDSHKYLGSKVRSWKTISLFSFSAIINSKILPAILGCWW